MKKIFITSAVAIAISIPALADPNIAVGTTSTDCTESVLNTTSGTANLEANWTANTLNIEWYNGDDKITTTTCTYDGGIVIPDEEPEKVGYTFDGWKPRRVAAAPQQTGFDLSTLDISIEGRRIYWIGRDFSTGTAECAYKNKGKKNMSISLSCDDPLVSDLEMSEWKVDFSYGTVKGIGRCSKVNGTYAQIGEPTDDWMQDGAKYCWCQATNYTPLNGTEQSVASSSWVFIADGDSAGDCANYCPNFCASEVRGDAAFRAAVFGLAQ